ncbi:MAG: hypothetical protein WCI72_00765 [archaeon]
MKNKKGLIGKILLGVLALIIIIFVILGVSAYQASKVVTVVTEESAKIETSSRLLAEQRDCTQLNEIENSFKKIEKEVASACKNPVIKIAIGKIKEVPVKCETLPALKSDFDKKFSEARIYCENPNKLNESITNGSLSKEELTALAQKYGIKI